MGKFDSFLEKIGFVSSEEEPEEEDTETYTQPKSSSYTSMRSSRGASDVHLSGGTEPESRVTSYRTTKKAAPAYTEEPAAKSKAVSPKTVNLHASVQMEVVVASPESFDEAKSISDDLRNNKPVVINLEFVEHPIAQRITDFLCGACYAMGGNIRQIADKIYMIAPGNVDIAASTDFRTTLQTEGGLVFPWSSEQ